MRSFSFHPKSIFILLVFVFSILFFISAGNPHYRKIIHLQGELTFSEIIQEAEKQLGLKIELPHQNFSNRSSTYDIKVSLGKLLLKVKEYYAQEGREVGWKFQGKTILIQRTDLAQKKQPSPPAVSKVKPKPKPQSASWNIQEPPANPVSVPVVDPNDLRIEELKRKLRAQRQSQGIQSIGMIPARDGNPSNFSISNSNNQAKPLNIQPHFTPPPSNPYNPSSTSLSPNSTFTVTQYPDSATPHYNNAPPILPDAELEKFIEWESRMEGAMNDNNHFLLKMERQTLRRKLKWLERNLNQ